MYAFEHAKTHHYACITEKAFPKKVIIYETFASELLGNLECFLAIGNT